MNPTGRVDVMAKGLQGSRCDIACPDTLVLLFVDRAAVGDIQSRRGTGLDLLD